MSTLKVRGANVDKVRELLGGANPTEARVAQLLKELDVRRQAELGKFLEEQEPAGPTSVAPVDAAKEPQPIAGLVSGALGKGDEDEEAEDVDDEDEDDEPMPTGGYNAATPDVKPEPETVESRMLKLIEGQARVIESLETTIKDLRAPKAAEDKDRAIGDGKLPVSAAQAAPVGFTGPASFPVGKWFKSPLGPPVPMMVCGCGVCTPFRVVHYFCSICKRGPFLYQSSQGPKGRKIYTAPGSVWGVAHECCSITCWTRYQELIGVVAGVNDSEPIGMPGESEIPDLHALPIGSD